MTFIVEMLPAEQGDAIWIEYGDSDKPSRVLVDAGTPATFDVVQARIKEIDPKKQERHFELLVVTHIDSDHIGGSIPLLEHADELGVTFGDVWFNGQRHLKNEVGTESAGAGDQLTGALALLNWNQAWDGDAVVVPDDGPPPSRTLPGGMRLTVLSPFRAQLEALTSEWPELVKAHGLVEGIPPTVEPEVPPSEFEALAVPATPADVDDLDALAQRPFEPDADDSLPNGSSIALLAEFDERSVLLSADSHSPVLLNGVELLLKERGEEQLDITAFKLPHHGSKANLHLPLLERLRSSRFLISTSGRITKHPHVEAIARTLLALGPGEMIFNYRSEWNAVWEDEKVVERHGYSISIPRVDIEL